MTAKELIQHLQQLQPDTKIVIRGYEDGYNDILNLKAIIIKQKKDSHWYEGEYDDSEDADAINSFNIFGENKNAVD